jgi:hypothetical protein
MRRRTATQGKRAVSPVSVTAAQQAKSVRLQVTAHVPAAGHRPADDDAPRHFLIGASKIAIPVLTAAQARPGSVRKRAITPHSYP